VVTVPDSLAATTFSFEGAEIRTVLIEDEPWWVATDLTAILALSNPRTSLALLDDDEKGVHSVDTLGGPQQMTVVSESGLYSLILRSRKALAKQFRRWVTHEVLPTIRRTGRYEEPTRAAPPELTAADAGALERRLRTLGAARRAGVLTAGEVRTQGLALLAPYGLAPSAATLDEQHDAEAVEWIHRSVPAGGEVSLRDLYRGLNGRHWVNRASDVEPVVVRLITAGHLRAIPRPEEKLRGRPPSPRFEVLTAPDRPILTVVPADGGA
jgi:hypothetical protein